MSIWQWITSLFRKPVQDESGGPKFSDVALADWAEHEANCTCDLIVSYESLADVKMPAGCPVHGIKRHWR